MLRFWAVLRVDLTNLFKNPVLIGYNTIFGVVMILVLGYLSGGNYAAVQTSYQYFAITFLVYGMLAGAMTATNCFMERDIKGANLRIIYSPMGSFPIYFSKIIASFIFDFSLHLTLILLFFAPFSITLGNRPLLFILLMAAVELAAAALGTFACCIFRSEEVASSLLNVIIGIFSIFGGTFFSLAGMGETVSFLSNFSPIKWLNDAFFALACDDSVASFAPVFLGAITAVVLLTMGCKLFFRKEDYL